jgi:mannitol 2-dehydrogenase
MVIGERLGSSTLGRLPDHVGRPTYDRDDIGVGIVHLGIGGFHRSHEAVYLDALMNAGSARDWGICGVGTLVSDRPLADAMIAQDGLYTVAVKHPDGTRDLRVIGSVTEYLFAPDSTEAVIERMTDPKVRIVSLTVTEGGYYRDFATGRFDDRAPAIVEDAGDLSHARTVFGMLAEALRRRRDRDIAPFTVMSCDNIPGNGAVARAAVEGVARGADPGLAEWIASSVAFPDSMVDRITPRTAPEDRVAVSESIGLLDECPVVCEPFAQWVLEDVFTEGRPPLQDVGVQIVDDVEPYELMKLRLLNCTHQAMAYFGYLLGHRTVAEAVADVDIAELLRRYMHEEAFLTLPPVPGIDLEAYSALLLTRYANPHIGDTLARLCTDGSDRIPNWLVPVAVERARDGGRTPAAAAVIASWAWYCRGRDDDGRPHDVVDGRSAELIERASRQGDDPLVFLRDEALFGDLVGYRSFTHDYSAAIRDLESRGTRAALRSALRRAG